MQEKLGGVNELRILPMVSTQGAFKSPPTTNFICPQPNPYGDRLGFFFSSLTLIEIGLKPNLTPC